MGQLFKDLRLAWRQMARRPLLSGLAVLSLGLGIGVNSSIFTLVNAILLDDLPVPQPEQLMEVYTSDSGGFRYATTSYPDYRDLRERQDTFSELAAFNATFVTWDRGGAAGQGAELLFGEEVSGNYFDLLRLPMARGRGFSAEEDSQPGTHPVAVVSHAFWQTSLGAEEEVLRRVLKLNGVDFTVVGVAGPELKGSLPGFSAALWIPLPMHDAIAESPGLDKRGRRSLFMKGRLAPGVTQEQAQAQFETLAAALAAEYPETNEDRTITVVPSAEVALNPAIDGPLFGVAGLLMGIVGLVLLIACSNIANLLLARASDRRKEIAIRLALGSGRFRLIRQMLAESLLLGALGGALALAFAGWTASLIVSFKPPLPVPLALDLGLDWKVLGFTLGLALLTGVVCGLAPALQASKPQLVPALKDESGSLGRGYKKLGLRNALVVGQVALSTLLLVGAGLFLRSLGAVEAVDPGFGLRQGVAAQIGLGFGSRYSEEEGRRFFTELVERVEAEPGVRSAALVEHLPLGFSIRTMGVWTEGANLAEREDSVDVDTVGVAPGYFETMGIALPWGRGFESRDDAGAPAVVVVNEAAARRLWPGEEPLGKRLYLGEEWAEVVGVAEDGKYRTLGEAPRPFVYRNSLQDYSSLMTLVVAAEGNEAALAGRVREHLREMDPDLPVFDLRTMTEHLSFMLFPARLGAALLTAFGVLGLVLASVGLYGVVAYSVARRTREVGVRMALGAGRANVLRLVVREGMVLVAVGLATGLALALAATRLLDSLLVGVGTADPLTYAGVAAVLAAVALAANLLPARRAATVDPMVALRYE